MTEQELHKKIERRFVKICILYAMLEDKNLMPKDLDRKYTGLYDQWVANRWPNEYGYMQWDLWSQLASFCDQVRKTKHTREKKND